MLSCLAQGLPNTLSDGAQWGPSLGRLTSVSAEGGGL